LGVRREEFEAFPIFARFRTGVYFYSSQFRRDPVLGLVVPARVQYSTVLAAWWIFKFLTLPPSVRIILFVADDATAFRFPAVPRRGNCCSGSFFFRAHRVPLPSLARCSHVQQCAAMCSWPGALLGVRSTSGAKLNSTDRGLGAWLGGSAETLALAGWRCRRVDHAREGERQRESESSSESDSRREGPRTTRSASVRRPSRLQQPRAAERR